MLNTDAPLKPWYKQFWPCFLFFLPLCAVVAGIITFFIAQNNSPVLVSGDYYKEGLAINASKRLEDNAKTMGLSTKIISTATTLTVHLNGKNLDAENLFVRLLHPAFDEFDTALVLTRIADNVFQAHVKLAKSGKWYISIKDQTNEWEINTTFYQD
ncbi:MAG: nitrogen fixation protein FixH [Piscirickettsiaceae bacterium]|nr:MAG: nitrogen fixation protein FixH [Piscirickettsiaceae bacterium]